MKANICQISLLLLSTFATLQAEDPSGWIETSSNFVRVDSPVTLNWKINVPSAVDEFVDVDPDKKNIKIKKTVLSDIKVLGSAMGPSSDAMFTEAWVKGGHSGWNTLYSDWADGLTGTNTNTFYMLKNQKLDFFFRVWRDSSRQSNSKKSGPTITPVRTGTGDAPPPDSQEWRCSS